MRQYFALVHKDADSAYGVSFPDLPGCFAAADEEHELFGMAQEALALYAQDEEELPAARSVTDLLGDAEIKADLAKGAVLIAVPLVLVERKCRYNVMLDPALVRGVDHAAKIAGVSRSDYICRALGRQLKDDTGAVVSQRPPQTPGRQGRAK